MKGQDEGGKEITRRRKGNVWNGRRRGKEDEKQLNGAREQI